MSTDVHLSSPAPPPYVLARLYPTRRVNIFASLWTDQNGVSDCFWVGIIDFFSLLLL